MIVKWLRESTIASVLLLLVRLYVGYEWLTSGWGKVTGGFDAAGFLTGALAKSGGEHPAVSSWWASFLEHFAVPNVGLFNILVPYGEVLVGLGLILGTFTWLAAFFGMVMNFAFLFSGTVSSNPLLLLLQIFIVVAGSNAGRIGLDYFIQPYFRKNFGRRR
ncbi:MAG: DoxX family protein [Paenibacillaceae bacterium]|uniref:DoxX family protein n=1 Tax=Paenibacillus mellifer TaxID=2937794 RepID=A0A9X1Y0K7_9BACL|nr:DoxX family protein [Paenibacillus mellifer]MBW4839147.1 DoxX family protein [Paenibacillaceae bacterium]MCK8489165.1 DoxX family protein [Paenibacillus mellifer]